MSVNKISVVTVCLNARDTIRLTLESVRAQTFPNMEHVIIDGGSSDGTQDIALEYEPGYFVSERDNGVYDAMDKGAQTSTGDIVIFLNAGDTFFNDDVCSEVAAFFDKSNADLVFGNLLPVYLRPNDTHDHGAFQAGTVLDLGYVRHRSQLYDESIHHQSLFYRRWIFDKCTYHCEEKEATGEYNLLLNAMTRHGAVIKHLPITVTRFLLGGISTGNFEKEWARYVKARDILRQMYFPHGKPVDVQHDDEFVFQTSERRGRAKDDTALKPLPQSKQQERGMVGRVYGRIMRSVTSRIAGGLMPQIDAAVSRHVQRLNNDQEERLAAGTYSHALGVIERVGVDLERRSRELEAQICASVESQTDSMVERLGSVVEPLCRDLEARLGATIEQRVGTILENLALGVAERLQATFEGRETATEERVGTIVERHALGIAGRLQATLESRAAAIEQQVTHRVLIEVANVQRKLDKLAVLSAASRFDDAGFKVFAQWDEDGLIQYLVAHLEGCPKTFVEFGVGDYSEANTRLLLERDNWRGMVIDSSRENIDTIRKSSYFWRHSLAAEEAFVDRENINDIIQRNGFTGEIGLLSIDVDGVDYWIWDAIEVVSPQIVVCEYNGAFGSRARITVPYRPDFERAKAHPSLIYAGASLGALIHLGRRKGYELIGSNIAGNNAFFVREDVLATSNIQVSGTLYRRPLFREARNPDGTLSFLDVAEALSLIAHLPVIDVETGQEIRVSEVEISYDPEFALS